MPVLLAQAGVTVPDPNVLTQYGLPGALLALALLAIGVLYRREVKRNDRAEERADRYEQLWRDEVKRNRRRGDE